VILLVAGLDIRVLSEEGQMLRHLSLDPSRDNQSQERPEVSTMSRDMTTCRRQDSYQKGTRTTCGFARCVGHLGRVELPKSPRAC
jgi:hypothetical protein